MTANMVPIRNEVGMVSLREAVMVLGVLPNLHIHMAWNNIRCVYSLLYASATRFSSIPRALGPQAP